MGEFARAVDETQSTPFGPLKGRRLYKTGLVQRTARATRMTQRDVRDALDGVLQQIGLALSVGETVVIPGFGHWYTRRTKPATVRSFQTGQPIKVPATRVAAFKAGELLKKAVRRTR